MPSPHARRRCVSTRPIRRDWIESGVSFWKARLSSYGGDSVDQRRRILPNRATNWQERPRAEHLDAAPQCASCSLPAKRRLHALRRHQRDAVATSNDEEFMIGRCNPVILKGHRGRWPYVEPIGRWKTTSLGFRHRARSNSFATQPGMLSGLGRSRPFFRPA